MNTNIDPQEIAKFDEVAPEWWDIEGPLKPLHQLNPFRLNFIQSHIDLNGLNVLDIGCGGGILTESLSKAGAKASGIDMSEPAIKAAKEHAEKHNLPIHYQQISAENYAAEHPHSVDIITCMELLEHVPDPASIIAACANLVKPGGHVFMSTLNRNLKSYLFAILGAEYVLKLLPKGTHDYAKFIKPSELDTWASAAGLELLDLTGITYNPLRSTYSLTDDVSVNYLACFRKNDE